MDHCSESFYLKNPLCQYEERDHKVFILMMFCQIKYLLHNALNCFEPNSDIVLILSFVVPFTIALVISRFMDVLLRGS